VLSGRGLCDELITRPEESYRLWCVVVCDLETSRIGAPYIYIISSLSVNDIKCAPLSPVATPCFRLLSLSPSVLRSVVSAPSIGSSRLLLATCWYVLSTSRFVLWSGLKQFMCCVVLMAVRLRTDGFVFTLNHCHDPELKQLFFNRENMLH